MMLMTTGIQRFCMHDGPGIRTTVFLKGCPLRCRWCHNPETQAPQKQLLFYEKKCMGCRACTACPSGVHLFEGGKHLLNRKLCLACGTCADGCPTGALELCGREMSPEEILDEVRKDLSFYGSKGGITLSGGEPFFQGEKTLELLRQCQAAGISTAAETCGFMSEVIAREAASLVDLFLWDIKDTDSQRHRAYTGVPNEPILRNLRLVDSLGAETRLRCILVRGVNTDERHYARLAELARSLRHCQGVEFLPYHAYAGDKNEFLGGLNGAHKAWIPAPDDLAHAKYFMEKHHVPVF